MPFVLGEDEYGRPRTTVMAVPLEEPAPTEAGGAVGRFDRRSAVLTVLHLLQAAKGGAEIVVSTGEVVESLPPVFLAGVASDDSRARAVSRILKELAELPGSRLRAAPSKGWILARRDS